MGLDLTLYAFNDNKEQIEIAYGRKTWNIYNYFKYHPCTKAMSADTGDIFISPRAWEWFIRDFEDIIDVLPIVPRAYEQLDLYGKISKHKKKCILKYEKWYHNMFESLPTLGYQWDAIALLEWYRANSKFKQYQEMGYHFLLEASY